MSPHLYESRVVLWPTGHMFLWGRVTTSCKQIPPGRSSLFPQIGGDRALAPLLTRLWSV